MSDKEDRKTDMDKRQNKRLQVRSITNLKWRDRLYFFKNVEKTTHTHTNVCKSDIKFALRALHHIDVVYTIFTNIYMLNRMH